jgi:hypothetical protein
MVFHVGRIPFLPSVRAGGPSVSTIRRWNAQLVVIPTSVLTLCWGFTSPVLSIGIPSVRLLRPLVFAVTRRFCGRLLISGGIWRWSRHRAPPWMPITGALPLIAVPVPRARSVRWSFAVYSLAKPCGLMSMVFI